MNGVNERMIVLLVVCLALKVASFPVARAAEHAPDPDFSAVDRAARAELAAAGAPGAVIGIVRGDRLVYAREFGLANVETGATVSADMLFRLGSTSKMFTAAALLAQAAEGKVRLDDPVGLRIAGLQPRIAGLPARRLLTHTSGLDDASAMHGRHDDEALGETVRALRSDFTVAPPGRVWSYSNPGYWLAGHLVETVDGKPFADVVRNRVLRPLEMRRSTFRPTMAMTWPLAMGHTAGKEPRVIRPMADNAGQWPAGSLFSSVPELARWTIALMNGGVLDGKQVLREEVVREMLAPQVDIPGGEARYGYGLRFRDHRGVAVAEHLGNRSGYGSLVRMVPDRKIAVIVLVNCSGGSLPKTADVALGTFWELEPPAPEREPLSIDPAERRRCTGEYAARGSRLRIVERNGDLFLLRAGREWLVRKTGENLFEAVLRHGPEGAAAGTRSSAGQFGKAAEDRAGAGRDETHEPEPSEAAVRFHFVVGDGGRIEYLHLAGRAWPRVDEETRPAPP